MRRALAATVLVAAGVLMMVPAPWAQAAAPRASAAQHTQVATATAGTVAFSGFSPRKGPMGVKVIITGTGFLGTKSVSFHGTSATFKVISNTRISAIVPCGATSGRISVHTKKGTARSVGNFNMT